VSCWYNSLLLIRYYYASGLLVYFRNVILKTSWDIYMQGVLIYRRTGVLERGRYCCVATDDAAQSGVQFVF
jgi:hypothetical protein